MTLTPTDKGAGIAGIAFASLAWFSSFKINHIAELLRVRRWVDQEKMFDWITHSYRNKALTFLCTEVVNFGTHGITNPASVLFACGSSIVNGFMIFVGLGFRAKLRRERKVIV